SFRRQVESLTGGDESGGGDRELLLRFARGGDEAAFALLVRRYGSLVLGVCRRVLHDSADADDAFQATFLVLARKAGSISQPAKLGNWLSGVACGVARKARANEARRQTLERPMTDDPASRPADETGGEELRRVLDDELHRLPDKWRAPLVLCYLEGLTRE